MPCVLGASFCYYWSLHGLESLSHVAQQKVDYVTYISIFDHFFEISKDKKNKAYKEFVLLLFVFVVVCVCFFLYVCVFRFYMCVCLCVCIGKFFLLLFYPFNTTTLPPHLCTTPLHHTTAPHHHTTPPHHTTIPHHHTTPLHHTTTPHHHTIAAISPLCCPTWRTTSPESSPCSTTMLLEPFIIIIQFNTNTNIIIQYNTIQTQIFL